MATKISLLTERRTNRNAVASFSQALTDAVGLRWVTSGKSKLKELYQGGGGFDSTPSELMNFGNGFPG